jgi:hypothetical protein
MGKLLSILNIGQKVYDKWLFRQMLYGTIIIIGLVIVVSIMVSAILIGGLYWIYSGLIYYGIGPHISILATGIASILLTVALALFALSCINHLRQIPGMLFKRSSLSSHAMAVLDNFLDGLMTDKA